MTKAKSTHKKVATKVPAKKTPAKKVAAKKVTDCRHRPLPHLVSAPITPRKATHLILVVDNSGSFRPMEASRNKRIDELVLNFERDHKLAGIETFVSLYYFGHQVSCHAKLQTPAFVVGIGKPNCNESRTALLSGLSTAITENKQVQSSAAFDWATLVYVLTDGFENHSSYLGHNENSTAKLVSELSDEWTIIAMTPTSGKPVFGRIGLAEGNIRDWVTNEVGLQKASDDVLRGTQSYTASRARGVKNVANYFQTDFKGINAATVAAAAKKLSKRDYYLSQNSDTVMQMKPMIEATGGEYRNGSHFYHLVKNEGVQPDKELILIDKATGYAYGGPGVRTLLKLGNEKVMMTPTFNPAWDLYIQSTAPNRVVMANQKVLCMKEKKAV